VDGVFGLKGNENVVGSEQLVSTGVPVEALGRMSLDEIDAGERSFSDPQESSEEDLGMAFSPGKMVDDIVGAESSPRRGHAGHENEEIIFSGRATRKQLYFPRLSELTRSRSNPAVIPSPIMLPPTHLNNPSPLPSPITATEQSSQPKTVVDLMMHAFPKAFSTPTHSPHTLSPHLQTVTTANTAADDPHPDLRSSPRVILHPYEDTRRKDESAVGVIGQGRASPRRADGVATGGTSGSPRWNSGFAGL
jgi:hypothetical protein